MTIQLINDGDGKSHLRWDSQSVAAEKLLPLLQDAAKNLHVKGIGGFVEEDEDSPNYGVPVDPETLTNGQLGSILNDYYKLTTLAEARSYHISKAQSDATEAARIEAETRYG